MKQFLSLLAIMATLAACSEHDCELSSEETKKAYGDIAAMTKGAESCFVSSGAGPSSLSATFYETTVDDVAKKYEAFLTEHGWEVKVEAHSGKRGNGKPYEGKKVLAKKGERQVGSIIYELASGIIDTTILNVPKK